MDYDILLRYAEITDTYIMSTWMHLDGSSLQQLPSPFIYLSSKIRYIYKLAPISHADFCHISQSSTAPLPYRLDKLLCFLQ